MWGFRSALRRYGFQRFDRSAQSLQGLWRQACRGRSDVHGATRRRHRFPRPERVGEVDDDQIDARARRADGRRREGERQALPRSCSAAARGRRPVGGPLRPQRSVCLQPSARFGPDPRHPATPRGRADRLGRSARGGAQARRPVLARHGPAARDCQRVARRSRDTHPRRAGQRPRPGRHPLDPEPPQEPGGGGPDGVRLVAPDERDGADGGSGDSDRAWSSDHRHQRRRVRATGVGQGRSRAIASGHRAARAPGRSGGDGHARGRAGSARGDGTDRSRDRRRGGCEWDPVARADAAASFTRRGIHDADAGRHRVQGASVRPRERGGRSVSSVATTTALPRQPHTGKVTQLRVCLSEWTKLRSVRSTRWSLAAAVVFTIGIAALACAVVSHHWPHMSAADRADFHPLEVNLAGVQLAQLALGVLGVLVITAEYSTGMIRASMTAVPRRLPVLWAKAIVYGLVTLTLTVPATLIAFLVGESIFKGRHINIAFSHPGVARAVIGAALYLTVVGLFGLGLGAIVRNTAGGIATFAGIMFVLPPLMNVLPTSWNNAISPYLPLNAGQAVMALTRDPQQLAPWTGLGLLCAYAAAALALAALLLVRRDT